MYAYVYVCMHDIMHIYTYTHTYVLISTSRNIKQNHEYKNKRTYTHTHTSRQKHTYTHTHSDPRDPHRSWNPPSFLLPANFSQSPATLLLFPAKPKRRTTSRKFPASPSIERSALLHQHISESRQSEPRSRDSPASDYRFRAKFRRLCNSAAVVAATWSNHQRARSQCMRQPASSYRSGVPQSRCVPRTCLPQQRHPRRCGRGA